MSGDILKQVQDLATSEVPEISHAAKKALELVDLVKAGQLSKEEFEDLLNDVASIERISQDTVELNFYRMIAKAYQTILTLKTLLSLF